MIRIGHRFTLVELLVVIAIIMILASMMMPALQKSRGLAKRITCVNFYKQLGLAVVSYAGDYADYVPGPSVQLPYQPSVYGGGANNFSFGCNLYINKADPYWLCPGNGAALYAIDKRIFLINNTVTTGYYFGYPYAGSADLLVPKKLQFVSAKSKNGWCAAEINVLTSNEASYSTVSPPHNGGYNVLYFDGHVQSSKMKLNWN